MLVLERGFPMTISRPWYKRYPDQFIAGTLDLTCEEKGAYSVLIDLVYARNGPVPDDPKWLCKIIGCHGHTWRSIRRKLLDKGKICIAENGLIMLSKVSEKMLKSSSNVSENDVRSNDFKDLRAVEEEEEYRRRGRPPKSPKGDLGSLLDFNSYKGEKNGRRRQGPVSDEFIERLGEALDRDIERERGG